MWSTALLLALLVATDAITTRACSTRTPTPNPTPTPTPDPAPTPSSDVFVTDDGVRFRVEVVATGLQIPWSMAFAPDGRLFVTERPGRVRILDLAAGTSELALTVDDVRAQGEGQQRQ